VQLHIEEGFTANRGGGPIGERVLGENLMPGRWDQVDGPKKVSG